MNEIISDNILIRALIIIALSLSFGNVTEAKHSNEVIKELKDRLKKGDYVILSLDEMSDFPRVDNEMVPIIAQYLQDPKSNIKYLDIQNSAIDDEGASILAESLRNNDKLLALDLSFNNTIGDDGARALLKAMKENTTLTMLEISEFSPINASIRDEIKDELRKNTQIKYLKENQALWKKAQILLGIHGNDQTESAFKKFPKEIVVRILGDLMKVVAK